MFLRKSQFAKDLGCFHSFHQYHTKNVVGYKEKSPKTYSVPKNVLDKRNENSNFFRLVTAFRKYGHKLATTNPVSFLNNESLLPELTTAYYGLKQNEKVNFEDIIECLKKEGSIEEALNILTNIYCKNISAEFLHAESEEEIEWFGNKFEQIHSNELEAKDKVVLVELLLKSQTFDQFLATKYPGLKRYGCEGAESTMAFYYELFRLAASDGIKEIVLGMQHRGRLNLLTGILKFPPEQMFYKLKGNPDFCETYQGIGDVLSHCISSTDIEFNNNSVHVTMLYNPSHLEAVNPISLGKTRAKQLDSKDGDYGDSADFSEQILNVQVHGDAAIIGQGINQECLSLSKTPHFDVGGTIHMILNNQIGFTTPADRGRSSRYCSDLAKIIGAPVVHVNGNFPELVLKSTKLVFEYQRKFRKDIFLDINCYRQLGHNELDDPTITNPLLYSIIHKKKTVPNEYANQLIQESIINETVKEKIISSYSKHLSELHSNAEKFQAKDIYYKNKWEDFKPASNMLTVWNTGVNRNLLNLVGTKSVEYPSNFNIHTNLIKNHVQPRLTKLNKGKSIDWSTAEALAVGSLLFEGYNVRISGQDVGRGTFSHRHFMLVDQKTNEAFIPLNNLHKFQTGHLEVANSILSEEAVLGYEYGMSIENPRNLIIWEAQFGDFFNGAQVIIDTFISSGEAKWLQSSGLVMMLPHGYDGAGPEHSSSRIERFLQLTDSKTNGVDGDNVNMQVCQPSTPAQYFHLLRRQMVRNFRKPLVIIAPKTLLRLSSAVSTIEDMEPDVFFTPVIGDIECDASNVKKILITSGKHYYTLKDKRKDLNKNDTAILRIESFCPFPTLELKAEINKFPKAKVIIWCQEEPQNMGPWTFVETRIKNILGKTILYSGREVLPAPAVGIGKLHEQQLSKIISEPFNL